MPTEKELAQRERMAELLDRMIDLTLEKKQALKYDWQLADLGFTRDDVLANDIRDSGPQNRVLMSSGRNGKVVVGVWLKKPKYATKQRNFPSDYRRFAHPIHISPDRERNRQIVKERCAALAAQREYNG